MLRFRPLLLLVVLACLSCWTARAANDPKLPIRLVVEAGPHERTNAIVAYALPGSLSAGQSLRLLEMTGETQTPIPTQLDAQASRLYWVATGKTVAGSKRMYRLEAGSASE